MKTFAILVAGITVTWSIPAKASDPRTRAMAEEAHALAVELAAAAAPYARFGADWSCVARNAAQADAAAEAVLCGLDRGDYCEARDAADQLHDLSEEIQDDVEDLDFRPGRWRGPRRHVHGGLEPLADRLEDVSNDLRRAVKRLDEGFYAGPVYGHRPCYGAPVRGVYSSPSVVPGTVMPAPGSVYGDSWPRRSWEYGGVYNETLGPGYTTPPAGSFDSTPMIVPPSSTIQPGRYEVVPTEGTYPGFGPEIRVSPSREPGQAETVPPGQMRKIERRQPSGPMLLAP